MKDSHKSLQSSKEKKPSFKLKKIVIFYMAIFAVMDPDPQTKLSLDPNSRN